ncbi:MAG: 50S ribosomal protein L3 [Chitinispirillales bacterium]|jgi:large subunit ribosomal protein L3|nr:50S ribosomal protein L3 [Chitinispirillales bacterium]
MLGLIGKKMGMTRIFNDTGRVVGATVILVGDNVVEQIKTVENDGYSAVQLGFEEIDERKVRKPQLGHFKKLGTAPVRVLKEFETDCAEDADLKPGQTLGVEVFENVKFLNVTGISKGRGHAGTIKKYNFQRGRESHGNSNHRERGSSGAASYPARVMPGLKMSGHMGACQVTTRKLEVVGIDKEAGLVFVKGSVPGCKTGIVYLRKFIKK